MSTKERLSGARLATLAGLSEILGGFVAAGSVTDLVDPDSITVLIGTWIRALGSSPP
ncbi:hypothetical protein [Nonomuraea basaltis]|uniref:hypothetical protein n=1 Tax=Nonomuraea basaltis TaxID=2495887 RepID=UPI0014870116|nr:hypothetical protein [Nonomuraea basaltis]